jgi:hypothetical protein
MRILKHTFSLFLTIAIIFSSFGFSASAEPIEQTGTHLEILNIKTDAHLENFNDKTDNANTENDSFQIQNFNANDIKSCGASSWGTYGLTEFTSQYSFGKTLSWGLRLLPAGILAFGPTVKVSALRGTVTLAGSGFPVSVPGASIYAPHNQPSNYLFHGSLSRYNISGGGNAYLESGDTLSITFNLDSPKAGALVTVSCIVP